MATEPRVVDNRVFLLGLDKLYRAAMQEHERGELLRCARRVADVLHKEPADVPIEGYYANDAWLTEYFRLVRALQSVSEEVAPSVEALPEFQRLRAVTSSALYGRSVPNGNLLPRGRDPLSQALIDSNPWTMAGLTAAAYEIAVRTDDISLVGLAARVRDTVVLAATRESVVLHTEIIVTSARIRERPRYVWNVDEDLARQARRFIDTFNTLFGGELLPPPDPVQAKRYWHACKDKDIVGRCVRIGYDATASPMRHYHWAIRPTTDGRLEAEEFWKGEIWTTTRYRSSLSDRVFPEPDDPRPDPASPRRWWHFTQWLR